MRVGGAAEWLLEPSTPDEFVLAWGEARERGLGVRVLGGGANLLIGDGRLTGAVISTDRMGRIFRPHRAEETTWELEPREPQGEPAVLVAWAGAPLPGLCRTARELGWSGLEGLVGVPGQVGGGVAMNAGGKWGELWDVIESVRVLTSAGEVADLPRAECSPRYRDGNLPGATVLGAVLRLRPAARSEVRERMAEYLSEKSRTQPVTERSSGCIFKNPDPERSDGRSAGRLIDECGGKELSVGDAVVSAKHANFIVNRGAARAADVFELIERVRRAVADQTGIELETEVRVWP